MATRFRNLANLDLGTLNGSKNKNLVRYNASLQKFETITIDTLIGLTTDLPTTFIDTVEANINIDNIDTVNYNGGTF